MPRLFFFCIFEKIEMYNYAFLWYTSIEYVVFMQIGNYEGTE